MNRKTLLRRTVTAFLLAALPLTAIAVVENPAPSTNPAQAQRLTNLKSKGSAEIDRRLSNLAATLEKLKSSSVDTAAKTTLEKQLQDQITSLTALKAKLVSDTELTSARTDVASIVSGYRVYALTLPKVRLVTSTDRLMRAADKLQALQGKLLDEANAQNSSPASGISATQTKITALGDRITAAKTRLATVNSQLLALQPSDYNADHKLLITYRAELETVQTELKAIRDEAKAIMVEVKSHKK